MPIRGKMRRRAYHRIYMRRRNRKTTQIMRGKATTRQRIHVSESEIKKEMREHPWASRRIGRRIARDHAKLY